MNKWHNFFMSIATEAACLSKDTSTKVGACIVKHNKILSVGYNGAPKLFDDNLVPTLNNDTNPNVKLQYPTTISNSILHQKNTYMVHAELNAVLNYDGSLSNLQDSTIYVTILPCHNCALLLAQLGVAEIIYKEEYHRKEEVEASRYILKCCGIKLTKYGDEYE